jgi:hypothetical protein
VTIYAHAFWAWFPFRRKLWVKWLTLGAVFPDLPYCVFFGLSAFERGPRAIGDMQIWESLWRSWPVCALHSFVPWAVVSLIFLSALFWAWVTVQPQTRVFSRVTPSASFSVGLGAFLAGWGSHIVVDMLTHRSDGYPIFWPISAYRFPTPVSYWEPAYHGRMFALVCDGAMAAALMWLGWRRLHSRVNSTPFRSETGLELPPSRERKRL